MFSPEQQIGSYILIRRIGRGGFGEVWLAERRTKFVTTKVAVKLPLDDQVDHEAIKQEAQIWERASGHPNVLPIIDADEYDGQVVIVSEFAPDGSLDEMIRRKGGLLSTQQTLELSIGILSGLEFLHDRTIIHRDLKPANVLLQGDTPRLTDFGISRVIKTNSPSLTAAGTPIYMAPEAFDRIRNVQTDIWSAGVMVYEMLTGTYPFPIENVTDLMAAIIMREPEPLPDYVPQPLRDIVFTMLRKSPSERYSTADEVRRAMSALLYTIDTVSQHVTEPWYEPTVKAPTVSLKESSKKTIAILPFTNLTGDEDAQFYEFSLADAVTTDLARLRSLIVRPSSVISRFHGKDIDPCQAGKEMLVNSVLAAGFMLSAGKIRVTAQLLDVSTGDIIWSDRIDSDASDIFAVQDTIAQRIISGLELHLSTNEQELVGKRPSDNNEAYEEYLKGRDKLARFMFRTILPEDADAAIESFRRATELDPQFGLAWSGLGSAYMNKIFKGIGSSADSDIAEQALIRAIDLDRNIVEARVLMCSIYLRKGEKSKGSEELKRLKTEFPNEAPVYFMTGVFSRLDGEYERSINCFDRLERLDPSAGVSASWNRARIYALQGETERAMSEIERGRSIEPDHPVLEFFRAQVSYYGDDRDEAARILKALFKKHPHFDALRPFFAILLAEQDRPDEARENLSDKALMLADLDCDIAYWCSSAYALLGDIDKAFHWLERSIHLGFADREWIRSDHTLSTLRSDPRFDEVLNRIT